MENNSLIESALSVGLVSEISVHVMNMKMKKKNRKHENLSFICNPSIFQLKVLSSKGNARIDSEDVRDFQFRIYEGRAMQEDLAEHIDYMKVLQAVLSKNVPSERYNGIMNLCYIFFYPNVTTVEIDGALVNI